MPKRTADDDDAARKRVALDSHLVAMPAEIIELIALAAGSGGYRALAATCVRTRRLLTQNAGRQERAKTQFSKKIVSHFKGSTHTYHQLPNGARHGIDQTVFFGDGDTITCTFVDDKPHGPCITRNKDGVVTVSVEFVHGIKHGKEGFWYDNGRRSQERHYRNGILHGTMRRWHKNGQIAERYTVVDGVWHGIRKKWSKDGTCFERLRWWYNKQHGTEMQLDEYNNVTLSFWFNGERL